jgi:hypothetical protein
MTRQAILAALLTLCTATVAAAQAQRATITGQVRDGDAPRPGVIVRALDILLEASIEAKTDAGGRFQFPNLRAGDYEISASDGGRAAVIEVTVKPGENRTVDLILRGGVQAPVAPTPPAPPPTPAAPVTRTPDFVPMPDRWRLELPSQPRYPREIDGEFPPVQGRAIDPYNQNTLKGDRPVAGQDIFMVLTAVSENVFEYRKVPTPSGVSTERAGSDEFFGDGVQYSFLPTVVGSLELFKGDTAFKPRDWAVRVTPVFNLNYVRTRERAIVDPSPEEGPTRRRTDVALQEGFGEVKLFDVGSHYDFVSLRGGIQPFNSDFRGFLFRDTNLGVRVFGTWGRNRNQWNVAVFDQLEKETNSELNLLHRRKQRVIVANYYRQDFLARGYTISASYHANRDAGEELTFDANGFLVRPSPIGLVAPHIVRAQYVGVGGDGHIGRLNLTHQYYQAFGRDELNGIAGREIDIRASFAAVEASIDKDWLRPKAVFVFATGDGDPDDERGSGFDAIFDNPNIGGGPFSFWNRQGIRLTQTLVGLVGRSSILPSLRSSKTEGQPNFVNPGLLMAGGGLDAELTRKMRLSVNANYLRFLKTESLERVLFQPSIDRAIGIDINGGIQYRPALNENLVVTAGASLFKPGKGFRQILTGTTLYTPFVAVTVTY